jgi:hypothetical protein
VYGLPYTRRRMIVLLWCMTVSEKTEVLAMLELPGCWFKRLRFPKSYDEMHDSHRTW